MEVGLKASQKSDSGKGRNKSTSMQRGLKIHSPFAMLHQKTQKQEARSFLARSSGICQSLWSMSKGLLSADEMNLKENGRGEF